ncbi:hypothetical protein H2198_007875 [Neophaeococcomyces mojaviensis]|uniref:Uncharacterized protein n=1 Tax=Neophaeococcomyces mojaviensis TaxID=3383035 RepID=A0ACC2ZYT5_9EURO|nr:hypothetical protein H2198_007875 [Knufia sp. JES_112]
MPSRAQDGSTRLPALPPTNPVKQRFVMLEESTKTFYDIGTETARLGNDSTWISANLSSSALGSDVAIVIPNRLDEYWKRQLAAQPRENSASYDPDFEIGLLVSVKRREGKTVFADIVAKVNVRPLGAKQMSWELVKEWKKYVLADELRNGLLAKVYGRVGEDRPFVHAEKLAGMPRRWHVDAAVLNEELDSLFASGMVVKAGDVGWVLEERRRS